MTCLTPAVKPASNFSSSGVCTPPMKPTLPVVLFSAAAAPTRNELCSSAKTSEVTLGATTEESSTIANVVSGYFAATALTASA